MSEREHMIDGEPTPASLVLTHGFGGSRGTWSTVEPLLAEQSDVVSWDLAGHGDNRAVPANGYSRETALADLASVIGSVPGPVVLVGHSLGGYLSMAHTIDHPESVAALALVATGPGFRKPEARDKWNAMTKQAEEAFDVEADSSGMVQQHDSRVLDGLASITVPTLLILGERDRRFKDAHELMAERLDAESITIEGAGHLVQETHGPQVAAAIAGFVASRS